MIEWFAGINCIILPRRVSVAKDVTSSLLSWHKRYDFNAANFRRHSQWKCALQTQWIRIGKYSLVELKIFLSAVVSAPASGIRGREFDAASVSFRLRHEITINFVFSLFLGEKTKKKRQEERHRIAPFWFRPEITKRRKDAKLRLFVFPTSPRNNEVYRNWWIDDK